MAILHCEYHSQARHGSESFTAVLPVDPPPTGAEVPPYESGAWRTVYLLHGFSGGRNDWLRNSDIEQQAMKRRVAVIMPDGGNRFYVDNEESGERYGALVGEELVAVTRAMFALSRKREDTAIAGLSMGGYGAIRNGLTYPDTFGAILAFSSALITDEVSRMTPERGGNVIAPYGYYRNTFGAPDAVAGGVNDPKRLAADRAREGGAPRLFLACGSEDFLYENNADFHARLDALGYPHAWWVRAGVHDFAFWNQALRAGLDWWENA